MNDKLTCYIIDDEPLAQEIMEAYVAKVPFLQLLGSFSSALEATGPMARDKPGLLFLDINMPDLDGISFISMLNPKPLIILTTAYDQYAVKAFELEAADYLLKPFSFERFYKAVLRVFNSNHSVSTGTVASPSIKEGPDEDFIFIKVGHRIQKVATADVLCVEGMKDYLQIHTKAEKILTLQSFAGIEEVLKPPKFVRVHRSWLVAVNKIDHIEKNRIQIGERLIPISESYADAFYKMLKGLQ